MTEQIVEELAQFLAPGHVLLIGEIPGTNEFPDLLRRVVKRVAAREHGIIVGLEIPLSEDVTTPTFGAFFERPDELLDGRSSTAMAQLLTALAAIPAARVVAMDGPWVGPGAPVPLEHIGLLDQPRDVVMAGRLLAEIDLNPRWPVIVLAGSEHTRIDRRAQTLGGLIAPWFPRLTSLQTLTSGGEAWTLTVDGPAVLPLPVAEGLPVGVEWSTQLGADGFHGYLNVGELTAALPYGRI